MNESGYWHREKVVKAKINPFTGWIVLAVTLAYLAPLGPARAGGTLQMLYEFSGTDGKWPSRQFDPEVTLVGLQLSHWHAFCRIQVKLSPTAPPLPFSSSGSSIRLATAQLLDSAHRQDVRDTPVPHRARLPG